MTQSKPGKQQHSTHKEKINELALFAGVGGGILAGHLLGWRTVCAVEREPFAAAVLAARQNEGVLSAFPIWDDICTFDGRCWEGVVDLVSGGFPCQAFSTAASGRNCAPDLWPEMRRVVANVAPRFVYAENVSPKAINAAGDDLEQMGYKTKAVRMSAADVGADHIRERYWLLAYTDDPRELLCGFNDETPKLPALSQGVWKGDPNVSRIPDGVAGRMDRLKASGNGQVPQVAVAALIAMIEDVK